MFSEYRNNFILLRRAAEVVGRRYESIPYDELCGGAADESGGELEFEGHTVGYSEVDGFYWTDWAPDIVNPGREEQGSVSL